MPVNQYQYVIEMFREDDTPLGQTSINVDWGPAEEWAKLQVLRRGMLASGEACRVSSIEPLWLAKAGEPYVEGFRVRVATRAGEVATDFATSYFKRLAAEASSRFIENGRHQTGDRIRFVAAAFRQHSGRSNVGSTSRFIAEEVAPAIEIKNSSLAESVAKSIPHGTLSDNDVSVFVPRRVLDEAAALSRGAGAKETGGILIGHLNRDTAIQDVFVEVTAQVYARHTEADRTRLTFTAETWTEVQAAINLRRRNEIMLGWWHSHPVREWCKDCAPERQQVCEMASDFFSAHDQALHRTVFPSAYTIALVANITRDDLTFSGFGWHRGVLGSRGFYVLEEDAVRVGNEAGPARRIQPEGRDDTFTTTGC